jgi:hypothetical protein
MFCCGKLIGSCLHAHPNTGSVTRRRFDVLPFREVLRETRDKRLRAVHCRFHRADGDLDVPVFSVSGFNFSVRHFIDGRIFLVLF